MQIDSTNPSLRTVIYAVVSVLLAVALTFYFYSRSAAKRVR
jgi:hypothetical protein